jgi:hypothetical protein
LPTAARATLVSMSLTLFDSLLGHWLDGGQRTQLQAWSYRVGVYVVFNLMDEPVWLAMMFC